MKLRRRHPHHCQGLAVHPYRLPDDPRVRVERALPQPAPDHRYRVSSFGISELVRRKRSTQRCLHAQNGKIVPRHQFAENALGVILLPQAEHGRTEHCNSRDQLQMVAVIAKILVGRGHRAPVRRHRFEASEPVRIHHTLDRPQQRTVDPTEHRGGGRYPHRKGKHRNRGCARLLQRDPEAIPQVLDKSSHRAWSRNCCANRKRPEFSTCETSDCSKLGREIQHQSHIFLLTTPSASSSTCRF